MRRIQQGQQSLSSSSSLLQKGIIHHTRRNYHCFVMMILLLWSILQPVLSFSYYDTSSSLSPLSSSVNVLQPWTFRPSSLSSSSSTTTAASAAVGGGSSRSGDVPHHYQGVPVSYLFTSQPVPSPSSSRQQQRQRKLLQSNVQLSLLGGNKKHHHRKGNTLAITTAVKFVATIILGATTVLFPQQRAWAAATRGTVTSSTTTSSIRGATTGIITTIISKLLNLKVPTTISLLTWKHILRGVITLWFITYSTSLIRIRQRQRMDATSEWGRYARHPSARGRAIIWLLVEQALLLLASQIFYWKKSNIRQVAGSKFTTGLLQLGPLYIKLGQIISCRKNLLGSEWIIAMEKLQDNVPAKTGTDAMQLAYSTMVLDDEIEEQYNSSSSSSQSSNSNTTKEDNSSRSRSDSNSQNDIDTNATTTNNNNSISPMVIMDPTSRIEERKKQFDSIFQDFDSTPIAAASLGQVHKTTLKSNGDVVAVKVQRPLLRQIYNQDFKFLLTIASIMDKLPNANKNVGGITSSWTTIFTDAKEILYREIDYRDEADNAIRFCNDFGLTKNGMSIPSTAKSRNNELLPSASSWLRTPYVYDDISTERLLVMEYVPSIKISNTAKLEAAGITESDKVDLADSLARAYLRQFCCNLFFSTDPHAGNLGVELMDPTNHPSSSSSSSSSSSTIQPKKKMKPRLVMYDFGQAATLSQEQADGILDIIEAIIDSNVDHSITAFLKMGVLTDDADLDMVREKVAENYRTGKIKANQKTLKRRGYKQQQQQQQQQQQASPREKNGATTMKNATTTTTTIITNDTTTLDASNSTSSSTNTTTSTDVMSFFTLPAEYAFVARAISQMDGVGKGLDPDFDFISSAAPYIVEIKGTTKYLQDEIQKYFIKFKQQLFGLFGQ